jgi:hypothetical protein
MEENFKRQENKKKQKNEINEIQKLKKKRLRQENSLGELTINFIDYVKTKGLELININEIVKKLKVKKRRIYDITNVLEGIGYIKKLGKNQIKWIKADFLKENIILNNNNEDSNKINKFLELKKENDKLDLFLKEINLEFEKINEKPETKNYAYVTYDDLKNLADNNNNKMIAIKAPIDTSIEIIDNKNIENLKENIDNVCNDNKEILDNLKKENQIFMESKNGEISVYIIFNNERENSINYNNENNNIDLDYEQNYSNNLFDFENLGKSNKYLTNYHHFFNGYNQVLSQNKNEKNIMKEYSL